MSQAPPQCVIYTYRVNSDRESEFLALLGRQWPMLLRHHWVTEVAPLVYRGFDASKKPVVVEIFSWASRKAIGLALEDPDVAAHWKKIQACLEERGGRPARELQEVEPITPPGHMTPSI